jgi:hypothetical protein
MKKDTKEKDTYLQTETDAQVNKKNKLNLSPSKSINKSPLVKDDNDKHKKTVSDFKKNSTSKDLSKKNNNLEKQVEKEKDKDPKKVKDQKAPKEKNVDKSASKNDKKNEKVKAAKNGESNGTSKNDKNHLPKSSKKVIPSEKKKEEEKVEEPTPQNAGQSTEVLNNISENTVPSDSANQNPGETQPEPVQVSTAPIQETTPATNGEVKA